MFGANGQAKHLGRVQGLQQVGPQGKGDGLDCVPSFCVKKALFLNSIEPMFQCYFWGESVVFMNFPP